MITADLQSLREALQRRLDVVADREFYARDASGHLAALVAASAEVEARAQALGTDVDPRLRHYLERQSYVKAMDWLNAPAN